MRTMTARRRAAVTLAGLLILGGSVGAGPLLPSSHAGQLTEFLVQPAGGVPIQTINARYGTTILAAIPSLGIYKLAGDAALVETMRTDAAVARVALNTQAEPLEMQRRDFGTGSSYDLAATRSTQVASTPYYRAWPLTRVRADQAQRIASGKGVTVAIIDTGVDLDHPALAGRLAGGYDFVEADSTPDDSVDRLDNDGDGYVDEGAGHGTHVAGIVARVAPGAILMPVRVLDTEGVGSYFDIVAGIAYAADHGAQVINLSLSGTDDAEFLRAAVDYAWSHGAIVVAAAGAYDVQYPARYDRVISVGATNMQDQVAAFSDFRAGQVTVFAPGVSIYSTYYDGDYAWWTGTSMAAPFVSGEAALLLSLAGCNRDCAVSHIVTQVHPVVPRLEPRGRVDLYGAILAATHD